MKNCYALMPGNHAGQCHALEIFEEGQEQKMLKRVEEIAGVLDADSKKLAGKLIEMRSAAIDMPKDRGLGTIIFTGSQKCVPIFRSVITD